MKNIATRLQSYIRELENEMLRYKTHPLLHDILAAYRVNDLMEVRRRLRKILKGDE